MGTLTAEHELDIVVSFMNTLQVDDGVDHLADADALADWLAAEGLTPARTDATADELAHARGLRTALRDLARANHEGTPDPDATARLNSLVDGLDLRVRFSPAGAVEVVAAGGGTQAALGAIVAATAAAAADDRWRRVKLCGSDDCQWAFYDASRNRSGRWCSMAVCGNRMKVRAFRERHD